MLFPALLMKIYRIFHCSDVLGSDFEMNTAPIPHQFVMKVYVDAWIYVTEKFVNMGNIELYEGVLRYEKTDYTAGQQMRSLLRPPALFADTKQTPPSNA